MHGLDSPGGTVGGFVGTFFGAGRALIEEARVAARFDFQKVTAMLTAVVSGLAWIDAVIDRALFGQFAFMFADVVAIGSEFSTTFFVGQVLPVEFPLSILHGPAHLGVSLRENIPKGIGSQTPIRRR